MYLFSDKRKTHKITKAELRDQQVLRFIFVTFCLQIFQAVNGNQ